MPSLSKRLQAALGDTTSDRRLQLLSDADRLGSISAAARAHKISYKAAWQAIETLSNLTGAPLLEKAVGGAGGGGVRLSEAGRRLLRASEVLAQLRRQAAREVGQDIDGPAAQGLRTSMRNQLRGRVIALKRESRARGAPVTVILETMTATDPERFQARITQESVQLLGLTTGMTVVVLCKATAVRVVHSHQPNTLRGVVQAVHRFGEQAEVACRLGDGSLLIGFCQAAKSLKKGAPIWAEVDPSAWVIWVA
jgi:molybdate transport system regulatory protein